MIQRTQGTNSTPKMAAKRSLSETESCSDQRLEEKRPRHTFSSIIGDVVMVNSIRHLSKALEPLLRQVVTEEVDRCLLRYSRSLARASSSRIQAPEPSSFQLYFENNHPSTIFSGSKKLPMWKVRRCDSPSGSVEKIRRCCRFRRR